MLVLRTNVPATTVVLVEFGVTDLGHRNFQGLGDPLETALTTCLAGIGDLLNKIAAKRIGRAGIDAVRFPNQMRNHVQVSDCRKKADQLTKVLISTGPLQSSFGKPLWVASVIVVRPIHDGRLVVALPNSLIFDSWQHIFLALKR